jgi:serine/threonine protein kinase
MSVAEDTSDENKATYSTQSIAQEKPGLIGSKLGGRYLVERELGRGGMGAVYLARDKPELHSRPVVVKVLLEEALKNDWVVQKFQQEIESLTRLDDPGVIGIFDAGKLDDGTPYLVMQYVEGSNLRERLKPEGMNLQEAANIVRQIGRSVSAAHDAGILHRDLKPENIMLRQTGTGVQVKIIDFGIAKVTDSVSGVSTATGLAAGTVIYMSPEQLNAKPLGPTSDIYALGVIAYEMLTGRRPFNPESMYQMLEMQRAGVRVKPVDLRPGLSAEAAATILKALAYEPAARYQRAQEFGDQLADALLGINAAGMNTGEIQPHNAAPRNDQSSETVLAETNSATPKRTQATLETAHVLFTDIVGYSKLPIDEQTERLQELQEIVRNTQEFQRAQASNQLLRLPTGDGMALSFFGDPEASVRCAVEISRALKAFPAIKLRMGVHSGLVYRMADINANMNVSGGGINTAQRVMDIGDDGHILVSKRVADDLGELGRWRGQLHDLGQAEVKHGVLVHVYNLYTDEVGNPELPAKLRPPEVKKRSRRLPAAAAGIVLLAAMVVTGFFVWKWLMAPSRMLSYSLTVQKMARDAKTREYLPVGAPFESTGQEIYGNGWEFRLNITPAQAGSLYLLNEGAGANGTVVYNVLFPTPANNNNVAQLGAGQNMQTGQYFFNEFKGAEKLWIIWSAQPLPDLDRIFKEAASHKLVITDPTQINTVSNLVARYSSSRPDLQTDKSKKQTTIKGTGDVVVSLLELQHEQY